MVSPITLSYSEAQVVGETLQSSCSSRFFVERLVNGTGDWFRNVYENTRYAVEQQDQTHTQFELTPALRFDASSQLQTENSFSIAVSIGTYIALQDATFRSLCSQNLSSRSISRLRL